MLPPCEELEGEGQGRSNLLHLHPLIDGWRGGEAVLVKVGEGEEVVRNEEATEWDREQVLRYIERDAGGCCSPGSPCSGGIGGHLEQGGASALSPHQVNELGDDVVN
jgi:hypothetical protein